MEAAPLIDNMVGRSQWCIIESGRRTQQGDRVVVNPDIVTYLLKATVDDEVRYRVREWPVPEVGQAGTDTDQVLLGDADALPL